MDNSMMTDYSGNTAQQQSGKGDLLKGMDIETVRSELANLRGQFDKMKETMRGRATQVDTHVHTSPYPYVLGALGLGIAAGLLLNKRQNRSNGSIDSTGSFGSAGSTGSTGSFGTSGTVGSTGSSDFQSSI